MEILRVPAASTFISFPMADATGFALSSLGTLTGTWCAWGDASGPKAVGNPGFRTLTGSFTEISTTAVYSGALAAAELPAASPYVMLRFTGGTAATQYLLINTNPIVASVTGAVGSVTTVSDKTGYALSATGSAALTETYAADGAAATLPQLLYLILAMLSEFSISSTTLTAKKLDGASTAATFTLNDAAAPSSITRAT